MKVLLIGINAKFIQTNLAIRLLESYAKKYLSKAEKEKVEIVYSEWNINQSAGSILRGIYAQKPDIVFFSVYIWNKVLILQVVDEVRAILPNCIIGCGGPEVSWSAEKFFLESKSVDIIIFGEGERTFLELVQAFVHNKTLESIPGLYLRNKDKFSNSPIIFTGQRPLISNLDEIPFPYTEGFGKINPNHSIIYYESSRGCPFSCAYCLSSIDKTVRYYSLERVFQDVLFFLDHKVPLVKFVDRTFNLDPNRILAIWKKIKENYNSITTFHFEIVGSLLTDDALDFLQTMPEGSIQFEIGIQSTNKETLKKIRRFTDIDILEKKIQKIPRKIHTHVDLIAGLPQENLESFAQSFDFTFTLGAQMVQLGFLKILAGTEMEQIAFENHEYKWSKVPPYEVLQTPVLNYNDIIILKEIDHLVDVLYNSGLMVHTLKILTATNNSAFEEFRQISNFFKQYFPDKDLFLPRKPTDLFSCIAAYISKIHNKKDFIVDPLEWLRYDFLYRGKPGTFPSWYTRRYSKALHEKALEKQGFFQKKESRRHIYARTEFDVFYFDKENSTSVLFVYDRKKNAKKTNRVFYL